MLGTAPSTHSPSSSEAKQAPNPLGAAGRHAPERRCEAWDRIRSPEPPAMALSSQSRSVWSDCVPQGIGKLPLMARAVSNPTVDGKYV
jgi:hypothetical protein